MGCLSCCLTTFPCYQSSYYDLSSSNNKIYKAGKFNPFHANHMFNAITLSNDTEEITTENDHFNNLSTKLENCRYKPLENFQTAAPKKLQILSLNIRSLYKNLECIRDNITHYEKFDILCFNETNLKITKCPNGHRDLLLDGFHEPIVSEPSRASGRGGGLAIYVNERVCRAEQIEVIAVENIKHAEFQLIKIVEAKGTNKNSAILIGNLYRSPSSNVNNFLEELDCKILSPFKKYKKKQAYIAGDINMNLLQYDSNTNCQKLIDTFASTGLLQCVSRPTRITDHSTTLIDHVYINQPESFISTHIAAVDMSDHLATVTLLDLTNGFPNESVRQTRRKNREQEPHRVINAASDQKFSELIKSENWANLINRDEPLDSAYAKFITKYMQIYDQSYKISNNQSRRPNQRRNPKPWILPWLEDACSRKNNAYYKLQLNYNETNLALYTKLKKFCQRHVALAKAKYYKKYFKDHQENSAKQWKMINNMLNRGPTAKTDIRLKNEHGETISNSSEVSKIFNNYFSNIAAKLKLKSNSVAGNPAHTNFLHNPAPSSMVIYPATEQEVLSKIKNLKNKATLDTKVSALKIASESPNFISIVTALVNLSFSQGQFPVELKLAKVVPIYKGGSKLEASNYRPISLLSCFSKIYEKLMHSRVLNFLNSNKSLFEGQYGFRPSRSCEHALLNAQHVILDALSKKQTALLLLIDFSKAFDMVDHDILLNKLNHYGIRGIAHDWFKSYLANRKQYVMVNGKKSDEQLMTFGVPQGSILGPLLFIIYINDLPGISKLATWVMYADDANIIVCGNNLEEVHQKIKTLADVLTKWVENNGLALNLQKTKYMIFTRKRHTAEQTNTRLTIRGINIERCAHTRFLGVLVDEKLTWGTHIAALKAKMAMFTGILFRLKSRLPLKVRLAIYHSFIQSRLNFCSLVWGFAANSHIESLFRKQKAGVRAVMPGKTVTRYSDGETPSHTKNFFSAQKILTVHNIIAKNSLTLLLNDKHGTGKVPSIVGEPFRGEAPHICSGGGGTTSWSEKYSNSFFHKSIFFKGPLLFKNIELLQPITFEMHSANNATRSFATLTKKILLAQQSKGHEQEWLPDNFSIYAMKGLRSSARLTGSQS